MVQRRRGYNMVRDGGAQKDGHTGRTRAYSAGGYMPAGRSRSGPLLGRTSLKQAQDVGGQDLPGGLRRSRRLAGQTVREGQANSAAENGRRSPRRPTLDKMNNLGKMSKTDSTSPHSSRELNLAIPTSKQQARSIVRLRPLGSKAPAAGVAWPSPGTQSLRSQQPRSRKATVFLPRIRAKDSRYLTLERLPPRMSPVSQSHRSQQPRSGKATVSLPRIRAEDSRYLTPKRIPPRKSPDSQSHRSQQPRSRKALVSLIGIRAEGLRSLTPKKPSPRRSKRLAPVVSEHDKMRGRSACGYNCTKVKKRRTRVHGAQASEASVAGGCSGRPCVGCSVRGTVVASKAGRPRKRPLSLAVDVVTEDTIAEHRDKRHRGLRSSIDETIEAVATGAASYQNNRKLRRGSPRSDTNPRKTVERRQRSAKTNPSKRSQQSSKTNPPAKRRQQSSKTNPTPKRKQQSSKTNPPPKRSHQSAKNGRSLLSTRDVSSQHYNKRVFSRPLSRALARALRPRTIPANSLLRRPQRPIHPTTNRAEVLYWTAQPLRFDMCSLCGVEEQSFAALREHVLRCHGLFSCAHCFVSFTSRRRLLRHLRLANEPLGGAVVAADSDDSDTESGDDANHLSDRDNFSEFERGPEPVSVLVAHLRLVVCCVACLLLCCKDVKQKWFSPCESTASGFPETEIHSDSSGSDCRYAASTGLYQEPTSQDCTTVGFATLVRQSLELVQ